MILYNVIKLFDNVHNKKHFCNGGDAIPCKESSCKKCRDVLPSEEVGSRKAGETANDE